MGNRVCGGSIAEKANDVVGLDIAVKLLFSTDGSDEGQVCDVKKYLDAFAPSLKEEFMVHQGLSV